MSNWHQLMPTPSAYLLDKVLYDLHHKPDDLEHYKRDIDGYLSRYTLTQQMKAMIVGNDVAGLYLSGVNPYILRGALHRRPHPGGRLAGSPAQRRHGGGPWLRSSDSTARATRR